MATIYCDPDGHEITSQPYASPQDEIARLQAENAALREIAREMADHIIIGGVCSFCGADNYIRGDTHEESCPVRRLEELGG